MEDIKSYLRNRLKTIKGVDMSKLIDICDVSRAKFYKCLREPWCFSDSDLSRIADKLNMSDEERKRLFAFKYESDNYSPPPEIQFDTNKDEIVHDLADKIIFRIKATPTNCSNRMFTLFSEEDKTKGNTAYSSDDLSEMLWQDMNTDELDNDLLSPPEPPIDIIVVNSYADEHRAIIFTLICSLYKKCPIKTIELNDLISTTHFVDQSDNNNERYMLLYSDWCPLMQYGHYTLHFSDQLPPTFLSSWNGCLIRYIDKKGELRIVIASINAQNNVSVYSFTDGNLYRFIKHNSPTLQRPRDFQQLLNNNFIELNSLLMTLSEKYPKITIDIDPCLTTITADLFTEKENWVKDPRNNWTGFEALKSAAGASELSKVLGDAQLLGIMFDGFRQRFNAEESNDVINLISAAGLKKFADRKRLPDMELVDLAFDSEQTIKQLEYYRDNLGNTNGPHHQHYYIVITPHLDIAMHIYKGRYTLMAPYKEAAPLLYFKSVSDSEFSTILYDYIVKKLLPEECRIRHNSPIMSDDMARKFIDSLIDEVKRSK